MPHISAFPAWEMPPLVASTIVVRPGSIRPRSGRPAASAGFAGAINHAPGIRERIAASRITLEKADHAERVLDLMEGFGTDRALYERAHDWAARAPREGAARAILVLVGDVVEHDEDLGLGIVAVLGDRRERSLPTDVGAGKGESPTAQPAGPRHRGVRCALGHLVRTHVGPVRGIYRHVGKL